uniref:F-box domain-containing protein n=1 Tax=Globisporangium ultimum (strain ATCC 200006 / CBS 805.95 / DAOM BR144) TaxID=431595 RepID=K3WMD3_GLOUD
MAHCVDFHQCVPLGIGSLLVASPQTVLVCKTWAATICEIKREFQSLYATIELTSSSESQMTAIYRDMEERGHGLRELTVIVEGAQAGLRLRFVQPKAHVHPPKMSVGWNRVFASCPNLLRLDLSYFPLTLDHIEPILDAALTHCMNL